MRNVKTATKILTVAIAVILIGGLFSYAMMMMTEDTRYFCGVDAVGNWETDSHWNTASDCVSGVTGKPDSDDPAVILPNKTVTVTTTSAECKDLEVQTGATVNIQAGKILSIRADGQVNSMITGTIYLQGAGSELYSDLANHTLNGAGAIVGQSDTAVIRVKSDKTLTLGSSATVRGRLKIVTEADTIGTTKFENKGTVNADATGGTLKVEGNVSDVAGAQWKVTAAGATMLWADYSSAMVGNFTVTGGVLQFDSNMYTTGTLTMTGGRIWNPGGGVEFNY